MPSKFLRGLAIAAGTGLAIGLGSAAGRNRRVRPVERDEVLRLEPLLDRLDYLELRIAEGPRELNTRIEQHSLDIAQLRARIDESEERARAAAQRIDDRFAEVRAAVPSLVDAGLNSRMEQLRERLQSDLERSQRLTLESFEAALEEKISVRIGAIESKLSEQSVVLQNITARSADTDQNLQRLIAAVEKLVERTLLTGSPLPTPIAAVEPTLNNLPFQSHLEQAIASDRTPEFRTVTTENREQESKRRRTPMAPLMMLAFMFGSRLIR